MHDLAPLTALGHAEPQRADIGNLAITERADVALASATARLGKEAECRTRLQKLLGAAAPGVGKATSTVPISAFWTAPDQWMLCAPFDTHEDIAGLTAMPGVASVTEQTDGWVIFDVTGGAVIDAFELLCPAPVRRMDTGDVQRSTIHHLGCFLVCLEAGRSLRVLGPRSSAASLQHALYTAARAVS